MRAQIRKAKHSERRNTIDGKVEILFKAFEQSRWFRLKSQEVGGRTELSKRMRIQHRLTREFGRHQQAYRSWIERIETSLRDTLKTKLEARNNWDEISKATDDYSNGMRNLLDAARRWLSEATEILQTSDSVTGDFYRHIKAERDWMRKWEEVWKNQT